MNDFLVSPLIEQQLPSYVRDEYSNFTLFIEKYYEWMEQSGNVIDAANALRNAQDIDLANDFYIELIKREFLPFFPESVKLDPRKFLKLVNQFYQAKGTPLAVQFLFRALFDEEISITYPKDQIIIASDGKWVLPLALRIDTTDDNIFNITKCLLTGQNSKATAIVEQVTRSIDRQLGISYIELYISNVQKLFQTGETVSATYNNGTTDITVSGRLIGSLSEIKVDANNRGLFYNAYDVATSYSGDPVTIVGGLNTNSNTPIGAIAYVGETTKGSISDIIVTNGGFGFRDPKIYPGSSIVDFVGGFAGSPFGTETKASISLLDQNTQRTLNVSSTPIETILTTPISNVENSSISSVSTFESFNVYPISFVTIDGSGGGYRTKPEVDFYSLYMESLDDLLIPGTVNIIKGTSQISSSTANLASYVETGDYVRLFINNRYEEVLTVSDVTTSTIYFDKAFENDLTGVSVYHILRSDLRQLGSLGRIEIVDGGENYAVNEYLTFTGGSGYGANAKITSIHSGNNGIKTVDFVQTNDFIIGGEGYSKTSLPVLSVNTASGANASLRIMEITGDGESMNLTTTRIGAISKLRIISYGYDYVSAPTISLRNADLTVSNVTVGQLYVSNTKIYQGTSNTLTTFSAYVDKFNDSSNVLRIYDYKGSLDTSKPIISDDGVISANVISVLYYGDGKAKAEANFENGLIRLPGLYLNTDGQVSADKVLQDGTKYHNFSYVINTSKDYNQFKNSLSNIVHPLGTKIFVNRIDTNSEIANFVGSDIVILEKSVPVTFNIANGYNNMISTNASYDLTTFISVGDKIVALDVTKRLSGTVSISENSNNVIGIGTNFIDELQDGDNIYISSGNTEIVSSVVDANTIYVVNDFEINSTGQTINVIFNDTKTVTFVNANTILVDSSFTTNTSFVGANVFITNA